MVTSFFKDLLYGTRRIHSNHCKRTRCVKDFRYENEWLWGPFTCQKSSSLLMCMYRLIFLKSPPVLLLFFYNWLWFLLCWFLSEKAESSSFLSFKIRIICHTSWTLPVIQKMFSGNVRMWSERWNSVAIINLRLSLKVVTYMYGSWLGSLTLFGSTGNKFFPPDFCHCANDLDLKEVIPTAPRFFPLFLFASFSFSFFHCSFDIPLKWVSKDQHIDVSICMTEIINHNPMFCIGT